MRIWYSLCTFHLLLCSFCVLSEYSALDVTKVRLSECATKPHNIALHSISDYYHNLNHCFLDMFVICTGQQVRRTVEKLNSRYETMGICGVLSSYFVNDDLPWRFHLYVMSDFNMNLMILSFHLPWIHSGCPVYGMTIEGNILGKNDIRLYCGKRIPWAQIYDNNCNLEIYGNTMYPVDVNVYFFVIMKQIIISLNSFCFIDPSGMLNFKAYSHLVSSHNRVIFRVVTKPYMLLKMHFLDKNDAKYFDIRDGPGELSPFIVRDINSGSMISTAYIVYIYFRKYINITNIPFLYHSESALDGKIRHIFPCMYTGGIRSLQRGESSDRIFFRSKSSKNVGCHIFYSSFSALKFVTFPILNIVHYKYLGSTVFNESLWLSCQFGGLFAFSLHNGESMKDIYQYCNNIEDSLPPLIMSEEQTLLVSMIWFPPYSHGFFKGSIDMSPCKYRNIPVTQSFIPDIIHLLNYKTACEFIELRIDAPKHEIAKDDMNTIKLTITNEQKFMGPTFFEFQFRNSSPLEELTCLHHVALNMSYYEPWIPFLKYFSYNWRIGKYPTFEFGILQRANIFMSECLLSKGTFAILVEKPFCDTFGQQGRMAELVANSMLLLRECSRYLSANFDGTKKVMKYVNLPESGNHKTVLTVWNEPECRSECNIYKFTLMEYITHAGVHCEYTIDVRGHTTMTFVSVHTQEPFLMILTNHVPYYHKYQCITDKCDPALTKIDKYIQNSTNKRFRDFIPFTNR